MVHGHSSFQLGARRLDDHGPAIDLGPDIGREIVRRRTRQRLQRRSPSACRAWRDRQPVCRSAPPVGRRSPRGRPAGATTPCHATSSKPASPASARVGISGAAATRVGVVTPRHRTLPSRIGFSAGCRSTTMKGTCPAITSSIAGTLPRYGTWRISDSGRGLQHFGAEMLRAAVAGRTIGQSRLRFGVGDEFGQRLRRDLRVDDQRERHAGDQRDRGKILHRIVGQLPVERLVDGERGRGRHQQRVAVRIGPCYQVGAERGRGARLVLDLDGRAESRS